jgi:hypothetical protein
MLFFSDAVFSVPENPHERKQYTASLNTMASIVMNWYRNILDAENFYSDVGKPDYWQDYITQYPNDITQIEIIGTDLVQLETTGQYQFIVDIKLQNKQEHKYHTQFMRDTFLFEFDKSQQHILQKITNTKTSENKTAEVTSKITFTKEYFNNREIAYSWLSYLDGAVLPEDIKKQFDQVQYSLTIGSQSWNNLAIAVLKKRQAYLAVGGHILRVVKELPDRATDIRIVDLTIEWRGIDKENTPVLANIQQRIKYNLLNNGRWKIMSVKEKHLLPANKPWIGLLC